nr:phosphonate C-P lyase system protein PhnG [Fredinandcohnia onubensis]
MKRRRRTEILINGSSDLAENFAKSIQNRYEVNVIQEPEDSLVMVKMRETSKKSLFYPGEVFVTESKVQIQDTIGIGIVSGNQPELAYQLAIIDAAFVARLPETIDWIDRLLQEEQNLQQRQADATNSILKTKVNFETMDI